MLTGPTSLVKDCVVQRNQRLVIDTADGVQVGGCLNGTVTDNTANDNGNDGIAVGQKSLVSHNTANEGDGIEAVCPSTVTDDQASGNGNSTSMLSVPAASILLIEDNALLRSVLAEHLALAGHNRDRSTGLDRVRQAGADLVVTDIVMPESEGLEVLAQIRAAQRPCRSL